MAEVWKFPIVPGESWITMPARAELLYVDTQGGEPFVWARVDPTARLVQRYVVTYGTGHDIDGSPDYVGSFQLANGALVFHVFSGGEAAAEPPDNASQAVGS